MVVREEERDPVRLEARLRGRVVAAGSPWPVIVAIAAAWALALAAQATGAATLLHHDVLIEDGPGAAAGFALFILAWQVMIAAMMLPSSLPLVRLFSRASAGQPRPRAAMAGFLGGYALVWSGFGALAFGFDLALHAAVDASAGLRSHEWLIGGSVLAVAGAFQFTSLKDACLDTCRHPAQFILRFYERGVAGGLRLGARHGAYCVGCCWALMLVMFAAGVASLVCMALLTAVMVHEKTHPAGRRGYGNSCMALLATASIALLASAQVNGVL
jgi:predicted metal-binding membrane protein